MDMDLDAAGRSFEFAAMVAGNLVTLHADFVLGFIVGAAGLGRIHRGLNDDRAYAGFFFGITVVLLLGILFLGLRLAVSSWTLFVLGLAAATLAWVMFGGLPPSFPHRIVRLVAGFVSAISWMGWRLRRPRVPDRLPPGLGSAGLRNR